MDTPVISASIVLMAFYLYLLVRPQHVRRRKIFWIGLCLVAVALVNRYFLLGVSRGVRQTAMAIDITAGLLAFIAGVLACYADALPFHLPGDLDDDSSIGGGGGTNL